MSGETKSGMQCSEFEALLAEALDGTLSGAVRENLDRHQATCSTCALMFAEAEAGLKWMESLDEVEPPADMVRNIMVATLGRERAASVAASGGTSWIERIREFVSPVFTPVISPRFAMSFGMAFFSLSMLMTVSGVRFSDLRKLDLTPHGISRAYYETEARVVRYYENMRVVYEIESRVRELKRAAGGTDQNSDDEKNRKQQPSDPNTTQEPDQKKYENYSREQYGPFFASHRSVELGWATDSRREL